MFLEKSKEAQMYEIIWILFTLFAATLAAVGAKKWGAEVLIAFVAISVVVANILAAKVIIMFGFMVPAGVTIYAISFMLTDTLSEFFGKEKALKAVWIGFAANLLLFSFLYIAVSWPHAFGAESGKAFTEVMSFSTRITVAALVTYLVSQLHDVWAYHFWGKKTKGKHLWLRNNASTVISQVIDTSLFITIAFMGVIPLFPLIVGQLAIKLIIAGLDTAFLYGLKYYVFNSKRNEVFASNIDR